MQAFEQDGMYKRNRKWNLCAGADYRVQVRFNVLRVLPRTGKAVKGFQKF